MCSSFRIDRLPDTRFNSQKLLLNLTLDSNEISNVTNLTFVGLKSLRRLSMRDNAIAILPDNVFLQLNRVRMDT